MTSWFIVYLLMLIMLANFTLFMIWKFSCIGASCEKWSAYFLSLFKYNLYIRYFKLIYLMMGYYALSIHDQPSTLNVRIIGIVLPIFLVSLVVIKKHLIKIKGSHSRFKSLFQKQQNHSYIIRAMQVGFFFSRRLLTVILCTLPDDPQHNDTYFYWQFIFHNMSSISYHCFLNTCKPYKTKIHNTIEMQNERFYYSLVVLMYMLPEQSIGGQQVFFICIVAIILLLMYNNLMLLGMEMF